MRGATNKSNDVSAARTISIHAPHAGRDWLLVSILCFPRYFNPRAPCGARRGVRIIGKLFKFISIHAPHAGRDSKLFLDSLRVSVISIHAPHAGRDQSVVRCLVDLPQISIHAPHAGRDSKSEQIALHIFVKKAWIPDIFAQNAAFQSVLPLADRQKLLYLRCEPLRKFLRAFASHYKIIGSSGR